MSQINAIIKAMQTGWRSTKDLIEASGSLTPLARLAEWRKINEEMVLNAGRRPDGGYDAIWIARISGHDYTEKTREKKVRNRDNKQVTILERRFVRVK